MVIRKFGTEHGGVEVDPQDPQGLSKTAMTQLVEDETVEEAGPTAEQIERREQGGRVTGMRRRDGSWAQPGEEV